MTPMKTDVDSLITLGQVAGREDDLRQYLRSIIAESLISPEQLHRLTEALLFEATSVNDDVLRRDLRARCSFCLKPKHHVRNLVVARHASICDACIDIAKSTLPRRGLRRLLFGLEKDEKTQPTADAEAKS